MEVQASGWFIGNSEETDTNARVKGKRSKKSFLKALESKYCNHAEQEPLKNVKIVFHGKPKSDEKSQLGYLRNVVLTDANISVCGLTDRSLVDICPYVVDLDISGNLFDNWKSVFTIVSQLDKLKYLNLSRNPLRGAQKSLEEWTGSLPNVENLVLNCTELPWTDVLILTKLFQQLKELHICANGYNEVPDDDHRGMESVETLRLNDNKFESWQQIWKLKHLPKLKCLILSGNPLQDIYFHDNDLERQRSCSDINGDGVVGDKYDLELDPKCSNADGTAKVANSDNDLELGEGDKSNLKENDQIDSHVKDATGKDLDNVTNIAGIKNKEQNQTTQQKDDLTHIQGDETNTHADTIGQTDRQKDELNNKPTDTLREIDVQEDLANDIVSDIQKGERNNEAIDTLREIDVQEDLANDIVTDIQKDERNNAAIDTDRHRDATKDILADTERETDRQEKGSTLYDECKTILESLVVNISDQTDASAGGLTDHTDSSIEFTSCNKQPSEIDKQFCDKTCHNIQDNDSEQLNDLKENKNETVYKEDSSYNEKDRGSAEKEQLCETDGIKPCPVHDEKSKPFHVLENICLSETKIGKWKHLAALSAFPSLKSVRIKDVKLGARLTQEDRRKLFLPCLPNIKTLNGSEVTVTEREKGERYLLRYFCDKPQKPSIYTTLEKKHGALTPLVDIDISRGYQEMVTLTFIYQSEAVFTETVSVRQPVGKLRLIIADKLCLYASLKSFNIYHKYCNPQHQSDLLHTGELEQLVLDTLPMSRFDIMDGDEIHVDMNDQFTNGAMQFIYIKNYLPKKKELLDELKKL